MSLFLIFQFILRVMIQVSRERKPVSMYDLVLIFLNALVCVCAQGSTDGEGSLVLS